MMQNRANDMIDLPRRPFWGRVRQKLLHIFRLTDEPVVKVYHGFGNQQNMSVFGHVFRFSPIPRKHYSRNFLTNTFALLRLFMVKPYRKAYVMLHWQEQVLYTQAENDGFFRFDWEVTTPMSPGWHEVEVRLLGASRHAMPVAAGKGTVYVPFRNQYAFISDIDDTFLVSHSSNLRKRLYVLLTENAHSREPFEDVVKHYQLLAHAGARHAAPNPFFFVSSSEWNLYDYIREFSVQQQLPQGVYLLNQLKQFSALWKTGQNNHSTKFMRIVRIMEAFPDQQFILLGDDTQEDPVIYASIVAHFPGKIVAVYLRKVRKHTKQSVLPAIEQMQAVGVDCCYFSHSAQAIQHSVSMGLIPSMEMDKPVML